MNPDKPYTDVTNLLKLPSELNFSQDLRKISRKKKANSNIIYLSGFNYMQNGHYCI